MITLADRIAVRERPIGPPLMHQSWGSMLFMHWPVPIEAVRRLVPQPLAIDTWEERAWVALAPFTLWGLRPRGLPALPGISRFHEVNVRTYVHLDGVPGVWFFSLDASSAVAVLGARALFHLPYYRATMSLQRQGDSIVYASRRWRPAPPAVLDASWTIGPARGGAEPGSLEFFLVERYCLYASRRGRIFRCRIFHPPWPLQQAALTRLQSGLLEAVGLPTPIGHPLVHAGGPVDVEVWPLEETKTP